MPLCRHLNESGKVTVNQHPEWDQHLADIYHFDRQPSQHSGVSCRQTDGRTHTHRHTRVITIPIPPLYRGVVHRQS